MKKNFFLFMACMCLFITPIDVMGVTSKQDAKFIESLKEHVYYANKDYRGQAIDEFSTYDIAVVSEELRAIITRIIVNEDKIDMAFVEAHKDIVKGGLIESIPKDIKRILKQMNWSYIYNYVGDTSYKEVNIQIFWYDL